MQDANGNELKVGDVVVVHCKVVSIDEKFNHVGLSTVAPRPGHNGCVDDLMLHACQLKKEVADA